MTFPNLTMAQEYRDKFFRYLSDTYILSVSYLEEEVVELLQDLKANPQEYPKGRYEQVGKALLAMSQEKGKVIGYDIIRNSSSELGNLVLDSFLLQNIGKDISQHFGVELNEYELLKETTKMEAIMDYMNEPESGAESHPWGLHAKLFAL